MDNIKAVFLDFDGVVIESTDIKTFAFYKLYISYGEKIASKAVEYHLNNQGIPRNQKFLYIHKNFLDYRLSPNESEILSKRFSDIVFKKILRCPLVDGILEFLKNKKQEKVPVFLISATPDEELKLIVRKRLIDIYFEQIFGANKSKTDIGLEILEKYTLRSENILFIGDSKSDYDAARKLRTHFIGRVIEKKRSPFPSYVKKINNFYEII